MNFFRLGGDSIKAIQIAASLRSDGIAIRTSDLLDNQTVRMLAERVSAGGGEEEVHDQAPVSGPMVPSPIQQAFLHPAYNHGKVFTQSLLITSATPLPGDALRSAVERLVRLHDALRVRVDGDGLVLRDPGDEPLVHAEVAPPGSSGRASPVTWARCRHGWTCVRDLPSRWRRVSASGASSACWRSTTWPWTWSRGRS